MTRLFDNPSRFSDDALEGFLDVYSHLVVGVPGGVVRAETQPVGKVAVVIGGGSGHYPAFCGIVGRGLADGAVVGNVFTSPSTDDVLSVVHAAQVGGGVLFSYGNYAGDVMNFGLAEARLRERGVDVRTVLVTDDIASAPRGDEGRRRGIAGDFAVFKIAGAVAEAGYDLTAVERVARHANDRTRTLGVAFDGCTLPGEHTPLFSVPSGRMAVGLGIHGEPGISEEELPTAAKLAEMLVAGVLAERPTAHAGRVAVILNGLGSTKYEELFIVWRTVSALLADSGMTIIEPEVGELVTSLDMAGCSLTIVFLDDELERFWTAPALTPAFRRGSPLGGVPGASSSRRIVVEDSSAAPTVESGTPESREYAVIALLCLERISSAIGDAESELGRLDAIAGDGDHGRGMVRGVSAAVTAARTAVDKGAGVGTTLSAAGDAWAARAGGTSGVLWGAMLLAFGGVLGDADRVTPLAVSAAFDAAAAAVRDLGKAEPGDKTMLDALLPFVNVFSMSVANGEDTASAWRAAAVHAEEAAVATAALSPKRGRARPLAERSIGHRDPGAVSMALALRVAGQVLDNRDKEVRSD